MTSAPPPAKPKARAPLTDSVVIAIADLVDDAQVTTREPSHSEIEFQIKAAELLEADPKAQGQTVGKTKRVRAVLSWALDNANNKGEVFCAAMIALVKTKGGFRPDSPNYVGEEAIKNAIEAFRTEGFVLGTDGDLRPILLDTLQGAELTAALSSYVLRARRGSSDAALLVGTSKDLLEATAAHIIFEHFNQYPTHANLPTLLGQAFTVLQLATNQVPPAANELPQRRLERALYEAGCAVNALRNKQGTGHGRPWLPNVTNTDALYAVQLIGIVSGFMLEAHKKSKP